MPTSLTKRTNVRRSVRRGTILGAVPAELRATRRTLAQVRQVRLTPAQELKIREYADQDDVDVAEVVRTAIAHYISARDQATAQ